MFSIRVLPRRGEDDLAVCRFWPKMSKYPFADNETLATLDRPPTVLVTAASESSGRFLKKACVRCGREQLRLEWLDPEPGPKSGVLEHVCQPCHLLHHIQELLKDPSMPASEATFVGSKLADLYKSMFVSARTRASDRCHVREKASRAEASVRKRPRPD